MRFTARGTAALAKAAVERAEAYRPLIEWAFQQTSLYGPERSISHCEAAGQLNDRGIASPFGKRLSGGQSLRYARRLGLSDYSGSWKTGIPEHHGQRFRLNVDKALA